MNNFPKVLVYIALTKQEDDELFFEGYVKDVPSEKLNFSMVNQKNEATIFENRFTAARKVQEYISKINWLWCESVKVRFEEVNK